MSAIEAEETPMNMLKKETSTPDHLREGDMGKKQQGKCLRKSPTQPRVKLYCCYAVIMVLSVTVIALSFALSGFRISSGEKCSGPVKDKNVEVKKENAVTSPPAPCFATCPNDWIGLGSKCFYFSEVERNWTLSQNYCMAHEAQLAGFETLEELNFLKTYAWKFQYWIGLHRESLQHPWKWTNSTEYNNLEPVLGDDNWAILSMKEISSNKSFVEKYCICSKHNSYTY
ncbi:C-type lectin domain family 2 member E-like [Microtus oregoni]|uniref:C-type lectin domain family 2 member E-like n=1 Tax=Microtus oregoni TaxID=111838 RepID=UPI001BB2C2BF|nr:C-type lectin domain family 2 member E-like [Microtus oregoni]